MTIRPFVLGFVLLISKKIRVESMRRGGLIMNDILKRFCWLDDKMTAGIVRRSFYRLGVISAFCDRARRSRRACSRASSRPPRGPALLARLPPRRRRCRRRCCSPARQGFQKPPASAPRIPPLPPDEEKDRTEEQHADQERDRHHHAYSFFVDHVHFSFILPPCRAPPGCAGRIPLRARAGRARNKSPE